MCLDGRHNGCAHARSTLSIVTRILLVMEMGQHIAMTDTDLVNIKEAESNLHKCA